LGTGFGDRLDGAHPTRSEGGRVIDTKEKLMSTTLRLRALVALGLAIPLLGVVTPPASAATPIGQTFVPDATCGGGTIFQRTSPSAQYAVPEAGVITSWSHLAAPDFGLTKAKLKVTRALGAGGFEVVGESPLETITADRLNVFGDVRIPVAAGDMIGLYLQGTRLCAGFAGSEFGVSYASSGPDDAPVGTTPAFTAQSGIKLDVAAILEPDADADGYGDDSQDRCPADPSAHVECPVADGTAPETSITKAPKRKLATGRRKAKVSVRFGSSEPGSTFACTLDGVAEPCSSPFVAKVGAGGHRFAVAATDAAGNSDPTPASASFRVRPRHRH
jgi:hypothetical protein